MLNNQLVQTSTQDGLLLSGLYSPGDKDKTAVILIHGFTADFYTHQFISSIMPTLAGKDTASISVQLRGTGMQTEIVTADRLDSKTIGSYYEVLEEAHLDISAWIEFLLEQGYSKFTLAGHSLGTIKSVRYMLEGEYKDKVEKLVLLAPFDKNGYVERKTQGAWKQHLEIAKQKIADGKELEIIPATFDDYPITYRTYYSWYSETELNSIWDFYRKDYSSPVLEQIEIPVKIILGDEDEFVYMPEFNTLAEVVAKLRTELKNSSIDVIPGSGHTFVGFEADVTNLISEFL